MTIKRVRQAVTERCESRAARRNVVSILSGSEPRTRLFWV
jgi:hypothetical protein